LYFTYLSIKNSTIIISTKLQIYCQLTKKISTLFALKNIFTHCYQPSPTSNAGYILHSKNTLIFAKKIILKIDKNGRYKMMMMNGRMMNDDDWINADIEEIDTEWTKEKSEKAFKSLEEILAAL